MFATSDGEKFTIKIKEKEVGKLSYRKRVLTHWKLNLRSIDNNRGPGHPGRKA